MREEEKTFPISSFGNELHIGNWISSSVSVEVYFMSNICRVECPQSIGKAFGIPKGFLFLQNGQKAVALNASESQVLFGDGKIEKHGYFA